eukprot:COSAG01_NODE_5226_length_4401_cov_5.008601_3_plen_157_part_00
MLSLADISQGEVLVLDYDVTEGTGRVWALWDENGNGYSKHDERAKLLEYPGLRFGLGTHSGCECGIFRLHAHAHTHTKTAISGGGGGRGGCIYVRGGGGGQLTDKRGAPPDLYAATSDRVLRWPYVDASEDALSPSAAQVQHTTPLPLQPPERPLG